MGIYLFCLMSNHFHLVVEAPRFLEAKMNKSLFTILRADPVRKQSVRLESGWWAKISFAFSRRLA